MKTFYTMILTPDELRLLYDLCSTWLKTGEFVPGGPNEYLLEQVREKAARLLSEARRP